MGEKYVFPLWRVDRDGIYRFHVERKAKGILFGMCSGCKNNDDGYQTEECLSCRMGSAWEE
jgi:hypothetical protein